MAESKRTGTTGKMNKDLDDRLVPSGTYRDALNVTVGHSESSDVGAVQNIRGNELISGQGDISGTVIGSVVDETTEKIYWFTSDTNKDAIYEYDPVADSTSIVLIDSRASGSVDTGGGGSATGAGGGTGGSDSETFTVNGGSLSVDLNIPSGQDTQYKFDLTSNNATSTGSEGSTREISSYKFEETDSSFNALPSQPTGFGVETTSSTISTPLENIPGSSTTRYFKVTVSDTGGVTAFATNSGTVNGIPTLTVSAGVNSNFVASKTISQNDSIVLDVQVSGGIEPYSYAWSTTASNSFTSTSKQATVTTSAASGDAGTYTCAVTDSRSTPVTVSDNIAISVTSFGVPAVTTLTASGETNSQIQFNANGTSGGSGGGTITDRGFYYRKNTTNVQASKATVVNFSDAKVSAGGTGTGTFSKIVSSLDSGSTYDYVAYVYNGSLEGTGDVLSASTTADNQSITFDPTALTSKPATGASYPVTLTFNNLPNTLLNTPTVTYTTGGSNWITSITRRTGTNIFDIVLSDMSLQSDTSPTNRVATIQFTNPTTGVSGTLNVSQTTNASIALSSSTGVTAFNKLSGTIGVTATVSFDTSVTPPSGGYSWSFFDTLPDWITGTVASSYAGTTTVTLTLANNDSGGARNHTFDGRLNDGNQNDTSLAIRDTMSISQDLSVPVDVYEYSSNSAGQKTALTFYRSNGSFQQATFRLGQQAGNTNDNRLRFTASPTGNNASEITAVEYKWTASTGGYYDWNNSGSSSFAPHFLINGNGMSATADTYVAIPGVPQQGGSFDLVITAPSSFNNNDQGQVIRQLTIKATAGSSTDTYIVSLQRTA